MLVTSYCFSAETQLSGSKLFTSKLISHFPLLPCSLYLLLCTRTVSTESCSLYSKQSKRFAHSPGVSRVPWGTAPRPNYPLPLRAAPAGGLQNQGPQQIPDGSNMSLSLANGRANICLTHFPETARCRSGPPGAGHFNLL